MENESNNRNFLRGFGGIDVLEDFPKKENDKINPYMGISENERNIKLELGLPKFDKDDIVVTIDNDIVSIYGSKVETSTKDNSNVSRTNRLEFKKSFEIPKSIVKDGISITHKDKILSVILPKNNRHLKSADTDN